MRWKYDTVSRLDDLMERIRSQQTYLRRSQCDEPDPIRKRAIDGRVAILARRFGQLSLAARRLRRAALATR